jgi:hypothetical protein
MPLEGFETAIPATERPQTHALELIPSKGLKSEEMNVLTVLERQILIKMYFF